METYLTESDIRDNYYEGVNGGILDGDKDEEMLENSESDSQKSVRVPKTGEDRVGEIVAEKFKSAVKA